jgi:hypothetical protein
MDSYMSSFTSGYAHVYVEYYKTIDGSGTAYISSEFLVAPTDTGFWHTTSFDWDPGLVGAQSFRIIIFVPKTDVMTVYFDNISIAETGYVYDYNGSSVSHNLTVNGDTTTITATDNTNVYTTISHQYQLNNHSPYINYTATLLYKQNVTTTEERFDFIVPSQNAQVVTRDLQLTNFVTASVYWSDIYTPKVVKFTNGLVFLGSDTTESMRLRASGSDSQLSFYSDYKENHPHFYYIKNGGGSKTYVSETQRSIGDSYSASINFAIDPSGSFKPLVKTRQPYGYDALLTLTNHADTEKLARIKAIAYGTENASDPTYGTKGLVGRGIGWTKSVFVSGVSSPYADLDDADFKTLIDQLYQDGVEIIGHSITESTDSRSVVTAGLTTLSQYNTKNWIDHGASGGSGNWEDIASQGANKGDSNYILDILDGFNYKYAWSYIDLTTDSYALNILKPISVSDIRPFLFYNNNVDDNLNDSKKIYLWSTKRTDNVDLYYTNSNVDTLINEKGVHISHVYLGDSTCENHTWYSDGGTIKIYPAFDSELEYIANRRTAGLLWSPTMATLGDYLVPLKDVAITYNSDGTITVTNNSSSSVTGVTLLAESNIQSVTIDNHSLVSFGGPYGDKELVLPTLASGASVVLNITYGTKDSSTPTIVSNDTGKNKVNEITGYWDSATKTLIMTAEAHSGSRSFTVTIPSLANKTIVVRDITSASTDIGEYTASADGAITFSATLGSVHTFSLASKYTLANTPTNFVAAINLNEASVNLSVDTFPNYTAGSSGYYFYRGGDEANHNSGWLKRNSWQDTRLMCGAYTWYVKYRNGDGVETEPVSVTKTLVPCGSNAPDTSTSQGQTAESAEQSSQAQTQTPSPALQQGSGQAAQPSSSAAREAAIQQVKARIAEIQQKLIELIQELILLIQQQLADLQAKLP